MGNGNSAYVQIDNPVCMPGDVVSGFVHVNIVSKVTCTGVSIKVSGKEACQWTTVTYVPGRKSMHRVVIPHYGGQVLFKLVFPIKDSYSESLIGQFTYPFTFRLPANLPGSFSHSQGSALVGDKVFAAVSYHVKAVVSVSGLLKSNIRHSSQLTVLERSNSVERVLGHATSNVNVCCCFNHGSVTIYVFTNTDVYWPGDVLTAIVSVRNNSSLDIKSFSLELHSALDLKATLSMKRVDRIHAKVETPGLKPGQDCVQTPISLAIPHGVQQQSLGFSVRHFYYVRLRARVSCASSPTCDIPINMYLPSTQPKVELIAQPHGWNPVSMPEVAIILPTEPPVAEPLDLSAFPNLTPLPASNAMKI